uniref:Transmembrane protein n=1 Tax=Pithovirus LCPAC302 TaxID=2506593 RepID=A0A481Z8M9_9VIRU|nr:MAG: hypothetical protein LCPAC302_00890 [Pithovirus LCPAC302]
MDVSNILVFTGSVTTIPSLATNLTFTGTIHFPDPNLTKQPIVWDNPQNVPVFIRNSTIDQLKPESRFITETTTIARFTANMCLVNPVITLNFRNCIRRPSLGQIVCIIDSTTTKHVPFKGLDPCTSNPLNFDVPNSSDSGIITGINDPTDLSATATSSGNPSEATNFTYDLIIQVKLTLNCSGSSLTSGFTEDVCFKHCISTVPAKEACRQAYIDVCFGSDPVFVTEKVCQEFFADYNRDPGPEASIDSAMESYCAAKYSGFKALFNENAPPADIDVCACHMPEKFYEAYAEEVDKEYPAFGNLGINQRCLLFQCANSDYTTTSIGKSCPIPGCISISVFNNKGTFNHSKIVNSTCCTDIQNKEPGQRGNGPGTRTEKTGNCDGEGEPTETWWDRNKHWVIPAIIIGVVILIFIIIGIIFASFEFTKKKDKSIL